MDLKQTTEAAKSSCMKGNFSKYRQKDKKNAASEPPGKFPSDSVTLDCGQQNSRILSDSGRLKNCPPALEAQHWSTSRVYCDAG